MEGDKIKETGKRDSQSEVFLDICLLLREREKINFNFKQPAE
jgi:hypothetical protein